jgi:hypothetical protein
MHLREYDFRDLRKIARAAGFRRIKARIYHRRLNIGPIKSQLLFGYYTLVDSVLSAIKLTHRKERAVRRILRLALVPGNIWLAVQK